MEEAGLNGVTATRRPTQGRLWAAFLFDSSEHCITALFLSWRDNLPMPIFEAINVPAGNTVPARHEVHIAIRPKLLRTHNDAYLLSSTTPIKSTSEVDPFIDELIKQLNALRGPAKALFDRK
jgi:hypothetical protein